ncbi:glycosyltransferase family 4 protein [Tellurirhabdus rosea]|uniref:glycosyltransferase family 4 protein n=1 Tax=Tellurirhabdus rosea TaxID=2674997 RepID=UPI00225824CA|nr:glycosyltransferase family 4 protein [Tellurirhabdus rosea]
MNILQISTYHATGGAGIAARRLNEALNRAGEASRLLVPQTDFDEPQVTGLAESVFGKKLALARFALDRLTFLPYERDKRDRFQFSPARIGTDISRHPLVRGADVLHLHWTQFGFLSIAGLKKLFGLGKPVVWTLHDMWAFTGGCHYSRGCDHYRTHCRQCPFLRHPGERDLSYRIFEEKTKLFADAPLTFVTPSQWLADLLRSSALAGHFPVQVLPNPIDTTRFRPAADPLAVRQTLGLPADKKLLLFGSLNTEDPRKGFRYVQAALAMLKKELSDTALVVFGKTNPDALSRLALPVHNLGSIASEEKMIRVYQATDALLMPSLEDNFPNTIIESLACGTPVVGFRTGGIPEQIQHRETGWLAEPQSAADLARGLRWVLDEADRPSMRQRAAAFVEQEIRYEVVSQQFRKLYSGL